ncbi:unnamed protein product [Adineta steineri]|uniref:mRNA capping enzyme adenylation domain-containing protein n=1 Tax=Adineta steineri TaxID=433720 RepID=A0A814KDK3_9BILA|nr:unnamed protein product [Adineta steineri]CAF3642565.1 unnamed protein product [Adineta steineri]
MINDISLSSGIAKYEPDGILSKWLNCPTKSTIINGKFVAFKTPIVHQNKDTIPPEKQWLCDMLIQDMKKDKKKLGLVIDLTNTKPRYTINTEYIQKDVDYRSILCEGIDESIALFAATRSLGISNQIYLDKLIQLYGNESIESNLGSPLPTRFSTAGLPESTTNERPHDDTNSEQGTEQIQHEIHTESDPKFALNLDNVKLIDSESADRIRLKCQKMCNWDQQTFPGSRPVSMDRENFTMIVQPPYKVSWKANGTRYMMLIEDKYNIYMIDRNNNVFKINNLWFPLDPNCINHLENTLLDGVFVIDKTGNVEEYLYYVYDIVWCNNENVSQQSFTERMKIYKNIINVRNEAVRTGHMDNRSESFSIHKKEFWDLPAALKLLGDKFQSQLRHESDGLIFQPVKDPYMPGEFWRVLKWEKDNTNANAETTADGIINATTKRSVSKDLLCFVIEEHIAYENY